MLSSVQGVVLAGGRSTRMGRDKASMIVDGLALVERSILALQPVAVNTVVVGPQVPLTNQQLEESVTWLVDDEAFAGPVAALHQAATTATAEWLLVVPCDLAEPAKAVEWLIVNAHEPEHTAGESIQAYIARDAEQHVQWLTALVRRDSLRAALTVAGTTVVPVRRILSNLTTVFVDPPAGNVAIWEDMDTPEDVQRQQGGQHA